MNRRGHQPSHLNISILDEHLHPNPNHILLRSNHGRIHQTPRAEILAPLIRVCEECLHVAQFLGVSASYPFPSVRIDGRSKFWHQNLRPNITAPAHFMTHTIMHVPKSTLVVRYSNIFFAFDVSGMQHTFADFGGGMKLGESGAWKFFCVKVVGIMLEDAAQALFRKLFGDGGDVLKITVGLLWVVAWLSWSTPVWQYPSFRARDKEDYLIYFANLKPLVSGFL